MTTKKTCGSHLHVGDILMHKGWVTAWRVVEINGSIAHAVVILEGKGLWVTGETNHFGTPMLLGSDWVINPSTAIDGDW